MEKKNLVIIGFGGMGGGFHTRHAQASDVVNLLGIYDIDPTRRQAARERGIFAYDTLEAVLSDERVDLVTVATPNDVHKELVIAALAAGKNVICEKPVAMNTAELAEMIEASKKYNRLFTVHQNRRWDVDILAIKNIYDRKLLGDVFLIESRIHGSRGIPGDWRKVAAKGGGMMLDWGVHLIDQALMVIPEKVVRVDAKYDYITKEEVEDGFSLDLTFESGLVYHIETKTHNYISLPRFYMLGMQGSAIITEWTERAHVAVCKQWAEENVTPVVTAAGLTKTMAPRDEKTMDEYHLDIPVSDVHDFYRNVCRAIDGVEEQIVKHDEVMRVFRIMEAAAESSRLGHAIDFTDL